MKYQSEEIRLGRLPVLDREYDLSHIKRTYDSSIYGEDKRSHHSTPSVAITEGGRIFTAYFSGGPAEPSRYNYVILQFSDDGGKTFSDPCIIADADQLNGIRLTDAEVYIFPNGELRLFFMMGTFDPLYRDRLGHGDTELIMQRLLWASPFQTFSMSCTAPDANKPYFSDPVFSFDGMMRNKPFVKDDVIFAPAYNCYYDFFAYQVSYDGGKTFSLGRAGYKDYVYRGDESIFIDSDFSGSNNNALSMLSRTPYGYINITTTYDNGKSWSAVRRFMPLPEAASARFYCGRLKSGNILFVKNTTQSSKRQGITAYLSVNNGLNFDYGLELDNRMTCSYPEADQFSDGSIYIVHDCQRSKWDNVVNGVSQAAMEIVLSRITEEDIIAGKLVSSESYLRHIVSKAKYTSLDD